MGTDEQWVQSISHEDFKERFAHKVVRMRKQQGFNQAQLAAKIGISRNYLSMIERGVADGLSVDIVKRVHTTLGIGLPQADLYPLPPSLREFLSHEQLPPDDIDMLKRVTYRGRQPRTSDQWRILYRVIRAVLEDL